MGTVILKQFVMFFEDYLGLCKLIDWPNANTDEKEIKNAFLITQHIEQCLDRLQKRNLLDSFLSVLNENQNESTLMLKNCFTDPAKYLMKKIINSNCSTIQLDKSFETYLSLYSEQRLEDCLTDLMVEAASKEVLLKQLNNIPREKKLQLRSYLFLSELYSCTDIKVYILEVLRNCNHDVVELIVISLLNKEAQFTATIVKIQDALKTVMSCKSHEYQNFWKFLFNLNEKYIVEICQYSDLFKLMSKALIDSGKLLYEDMSAEYFYINMSYSELAYTLRKICSCPELKMEFFMYVMESNSNYDYWENML